MIPNLMSNGRCTIPVKPGAAQTQPSQGAVPCIDMGSEINPDQVIGACSAALNSARYSEKVQGRVFHRRGNAYQQKGQHDLAIKDYNDALRYRTDLFEVRVDRGNSLVVVAKYDEAIQDFDTVIKDHPDHARAHVGRGNANAGKN